MNSVLLLAALFQAQVDGPVFVFGRQAWYQTVKGDEEVFSGILERIPGTGATSRNAFLLTMALEGKNTTREVFIGADNRQLVPYVNRRVRITGMAIDLKVDGRMKYEIWPNRLEVFGGGIGPVGPIGGLEGGAVNIIRAANWNVPLPKAGAFPRPGTGHVQQIARSHDEFVRAVGNQQNLNHVLKSLNLPGVDFRKHMVILCSGGVVQGPGYTFEVTGLEMVERIMVVRWQLLKPNGVQMNLNLSNPGKILVVPRSDFPVRFDPRAV